MQKCGFFNLSKPKLPPFAVLALANDGVSQKVIGRDREKGKPAVKNFSRIILPSAWPVRTFEVFAKWASFFQGYCTAAREREAPRRHRESILLCRRT